MADQKHPAATTPEMATACALCAVGHMPHWQPHSGEWVHHRIQRLPTGQQFSSSVCGANSIRKGGK